MALRIGCTVDELTHRLSSVEYREWVAYFDEGDSILDLQAERKNDLRTGVLGSVIANCLSTGKRKFKPSDFTPTYESESEAPKRKSNEELHRAAMRLAAAFRR